jgi:hypothetical protein
MRKIIRYIFGWGLLLSIAMIWINPMSYIENYNEKNFLYDKKKNARGSITYLLENSNSLTFSIPNYVEKLKYIATANLYAAPEQDENIYDIRYSIRYELLDNHGEIVHSKLYHLRTSYLKFVDKNRALTEKFFYLKGSLKPTLGQDFVVDLSLYKNVKKIRLKLEDRDSRIADIGLRSYQEERISSKRRKSVWERMSHTQREKIARGNLYDIPMMRKEEKHNLLSSLWKPNGPLGVEGEEYQTRRLFIVTGDTADEIYSFVPFYSNFYADENISATRYLPKGKYEMSFTPLHTEPIEIKLRMYNNYLLVKEKKVLLENEKKTLSFTTEEAGVVEVESNKAVTMVLRDGTNKMDIDTAVPLASGYYEINNTTPISYYFYSPHKRYLRLECRSRDTNLSRIWIKMRDKNDNIVDSLDTNISFELSRYDFIEPFQAVSEPTYLYLTLPAIVKTVDISAQHDLSLRLATRSDSRPYPIYSYIAQEKPDETLLSSWFTIRAKKFNDLSIKERETKLYKQKRPPRVNPLIEMGEFDYEQLYPTTRWSAYELLLKRGLDNQYIRSQSWGSILTPLEAMRDKKLIFHNDIGLKELSPTLTYIQKESKVENLSLYIDNKFIDTYTLYRARGKIKLPTVNANQEYTFRIESNRNIDFFITNSASISPLYIKRSFIKFDKPMQFLVEKKLSQESIGVQLAVTDISKTSVYAIDLNIKGIEPINRLLTTSFTFNNYRLHADTSQQKAIDISNKQEIYLSETQFLTLGENLKSGLYTITVYPPPGIKNVYLLLNHILLGTKSKIRISKEEY